MIQKLFKPYIVKRKNGQCQVLIPLVELDELCEKIEKKVKKDTKIMIEVKNNDPDWLEDLAVRLVDDIRCLLKKK